MSKKKISYIKFSDLQLQRRAHFYVSSSVDYRYNLINLLRAYNERYGQKVLTASDSAVYVIGDEKVGFGFSICEYTRKPSFLKEDGVLEERRFGILVLVCMKNWLAVYTAGGASWSDTLDDSVRRINGDVVARFLSGASKIQRLGVRNMGIARNSMRAQSYEADDVSCALAPLGQSRKIVNAVRVLLGDKIFKANPATGMLTESGDDLDAEAYSRWVVETRNALIKAPMEIGFLGYFARPMKLEELPSKVHPVGVLLDLEWLIEIIESGDAELRIFCGKDCSRLIPRPVVLRAIQIFSEVAEVKVHPTDGKRYVVEYVGLPRRFSVTLHKKVASYSLQDKRLKKIFVCHTRTGKKETISEALRGNRCIQLAMSNIEYAFAYGELFRDERVRSQVGVLSSSILGLAALSSCLSEKGEEDGDDADGQCGLPIDATCFPSQSIFHVIEHELAKGDDILICDDVSGDEWADYIGLRLGDPLITLYHAKHGEAGTSAKKFQEVLGQAMKNLGRLAVTEEDVMVKASSWAEGWRKTHPDLARIRRSAPGMPPEQAYTDLSARTRTRKRVCVVVTFTSKDRLDAIIKRVSDGKSIRAHQTQLILLLVAFISACREMGAEALLVCPDAKQGPKKDTAKKTSAKKAKPTATTLPLFATESDENEDA